MNTVMGNSLWHLVMQSDAVSKVVLIILLLLSMLCWSIFFYYLLLARIKKKQLRTAYDKTIKAATKNDIVQLALFNESTVASPLFSALTASMAANVIEREMLNQQLVAGVDEIIQDQEAVMPIFTATIAISPLLGLFGTVWGLIHAFMRISEKQSADIATVAPGIAEALITTLAGLMVAIPAVVMFSYLQSQVRTLEYYALRLADTLSIAISRVTL